MNRSRHNLARFTREVKTLPRGKWQTENAKSRLQTHLNLFGCQAASTFAKGGAATRMTWVARNDLLTRTRHVSMRPVHSNPQSPDQSVYRLVLESDDAIINREGAWRLN